jgi:hypothetical protein
MPKTKKAQMIVIKRTPREAFSISKRLNARNIKRFGNTHKLIACVSISESAIMSRYEFSDFGAAENR